MKSAKLLILNFSFLILLAFSSCKEETVIGSLSLSSSHDCDIRLFDSQGRQIARENYETEKPPVIIQMKHSGVFIVHAEFVGAGLAPAQTKIKDPIAYPGGVFEHYIEFP